MQASAAGAGAMSLAHMLRMYAAQECLPDEGMEESIDDSQVAKLTYRRFWEEAIGVPKPASKAFRRGGPEVVTAGQMVHRTV